MEEAAGEEQMDIDAKDADDTLHAQQEADERWEPSSSEAAEMDVREPETLEAETLEAFDEGLEGAETVADLLR